MIVTAKLKCRRSGKIEIRDEIPLGKEYRVETSSLKMMKELDKETLEVSEQLYIMDVKTQEYLPLGLLEVEGMEDIQDAQLRKDV